MARSVGNRLPPSLVKAIDETHYVKVRAGADSDHRFIAIWPVVVDGRVFARSWNQARGGWYRTSLADPIGTLQVGTREVRVRVRRVRGERLRDAIERAYAEKYVTPASLKWVRGFRAARRRDTTIEFLRATRKRI